MPTKHKGTPDEIRALDVYIKLQRAAETVMTRTTAHLADYDLSVSQFAVLEALYHLGVLSQRELATKLLQSTGNISTVLKKLERRGMISRERDSKDNRYMQVCITDAGKEILKRCFEPHVRGIVMELSILTANEQEELARLCRKLGLQE
jgi:MarR family 2-MHQ and catechol resistance regulon transcriptional repressor